MTQKQISIWLPGLQNAYFQSKKWMQEVNILSGSRAKEVSNCWWAGQYLHRGICPMFDHCGCRRVVVAQAPLNSCLQLEKVSWKAAHAFLTLVALSSSHSDFCLSSVLPVSFTTSTTTSTCWQTSSSTSAQQSTPSSTTWCRQTSARSSSPRSPFCACLGGRRRNDWPSPGNPTASPATTRFPARSQGKLRTEAKGGGETQLIVESKLERGLCDFHAWSPNSRNTNVFSKVIFVGKNRLCSASNFEVIFEHWPCLLWVMSTCIVTSVWHKSRYGVNWEAKMCST